MFAEHATHAQSHSGGTQVENFLAGNMLIGSVEETFHVIFDGILFLAWVWSTDCFQEQSPERSRYAATAIILFRRDTSIIDRHEIIAGAHKWLLSTMSSSFPAVALR